MGIDQIIKERRSIIRFKDKKVPNTIINEILESAIYAPSSGNLQNLRIILTKKNNSLIEACYNQESVRTSSFLVIILSDNTELNINYKNKGDFFAIQNNAAAIQNMLLKAHSLNVGSCWIGSFNEELLKIKLRIPEDIHVHTILAFGYPNEIPIMPLKNSIRSILYFDEYGNKKKKNIFGGKK